MIASIEEVARVCHEVNRALRIAYGDTTQLSWDESPQSQRLHTTEIVCFLINHPGVQASAIHDRWCRDKLREGWVYGADLDANAVPPTHPSLIQFEDLPLEQKVADSIFRAIVKTINSATRASLSLTNAKCFIER